MVSSVVESEWDQDQVDLLIAEERLRVLTGPNGEYMPDATAPGANPNEYASGYRYVVDGPHTNWAERARLDAIDQYKKQAGENANLNGMFWTVERLDY